MLACIVCRVSTTDQQQDGYSLSAQQARLLDYCKRKNLEVIKIYQIVESSTRGNRKQFMQMIEFCKAQSETIAIVSDTIDRLSRNFRLYSLMEDLIKQEKIELHFLRESMVIGKNASTADILRFDFGLIMAKSYVLTLSSNVLRSLNYKLKRGEIIGCSPMGYENFVDSNGKHSVRPKYPDANYVKELFELYSLGGTSMHELARLANKMGLTTYSGNHLTATSIQFMLDNPFYFGEMRLRTRGIQVKHVYEPLISKELWDRCQEQRKRQAAKPFNIGDIPFLYRGVFQDYNKHKTCPCEIKKKTHTYVVSYKENGTRIYTPERDIDNQMISILDQITIPEQMITDFKEYVQSNQQSEIDYTHQEIDRLKSEISKIDQQLNRLLEMRMAEEIDKKEYKTRKADYILKKSRLETQLNVLYMGDDGFNATILNMLKILSKSKSIFQSNTSQTNKQLLLHLLFSHIVLKEGDVTCNLNEPFCYLLSDEPIKAIGKNAGQKNESCELQESQGLQADFDGFSESVKNERFEPKILLKNQEVRLQNITSVLSGWAGWIRTNE